MEKTNISRICNICKINQPITNFSKRPIDKGGHFLFCIRCGTEKSKAYQKTRFGIVSYMITSQRAKAKKHKHKEVEYTTDEFREWVFNNSKFESMYILWVNSGYNKDFKPTTDRLDNTKGYSFDNIQLLTWRENLDKQFLSVKNEGKNSPNLRKVIKMDIDGNFIDEYYSISEASRKNNIRASNIQRYCAGTRNPTNKLRWAYK